MSDEAWNPSIDPDFKAWAAHQHAHVMPMIRDSELTMQLVPKGELDLKFAVELGMSIMLDKPIISVVHPGQQIPEHLRRCSDAVIEIDLNDPNQRASMQAKITEVMEGLSDQDRD